jgi:hypothetical protein
MPKKPGKKPVPPKSFKQAERAEAKETSKGASRETERLGTAEQSMGILVGGAKKRKASGAPRTSAKHNPGKRAMSAATAKANRAVRKSIPKGMNVAGLTSKY